MTGREERMYAGLIMIFTGIAISLLAFILKDANPATSQFYEDNTVWYVILTAVVGAIFEVPGFIGFGKYFFSE